MRMIVALSALAVAAPAVGQPYAGSALARESQAYADAAAARNRDIQLTNELAALQARLQSDQALNDLRMAREVPSVPTIVLGPGDPPPRIDVGQLATIPDATLAKSNASARAAADNRR